MISKTKPVTNPEGLAPYAPRFFDAWQYRTLSALCEAIIPADDHSGGAIQAGVPEFIDLLASENPQYQERIAKGLDWLDAACVARFGFRYLECTSSQQAEVLNQITYRQNGNGDEALRTGIDCFALLRKLTVGGFFTSKIGIEYLPYIGNGYLREFPGCPLPRGWPLLRTPASDRNGGSRG